MPNVRTLTIDGVTYDLQDNVSGYAPLASPAFTGTPSAPTAASGTNTTQIATTAFVQNALSSSDTKVTQTAATPSSYSYWRPLIVGYSSSSTEGSSPTTQTDTTFTFNTLTVQPSTGTVRAGKYSLYSGNYTAVLSPATLTANRTITIPDKTGTVALISDIPTVPSSTGSGTTGISIADHSTATIYGVSSSTTSVTGVDGSTSVYGVKSGTNSTTTASKASGGNGTAPSWTFEEISIPNVTATGSASSWTFEEKTIPNVTSAGSASSWTFEEKSIPNVTAAGSGSASLTFTMDTTDTKKLKIAFSHTHTAPTLGTAIKVQSKSGGSNGSAPTLGTAIKVQSKSGGSNGSAPTLGTAIKVQSKSGGSNGSASTWSFTDVTVPIRADSATTVPTAASSATTVPIKNTSSTTVVTSKTHSVTDNGHTHTI